MAKQPGNGSRPSPGCWKRPRRPSSLTIAKAKLRPGRLKVFDGDIRVTIRSPSSGAASAAGTCALSSRIRSQWISSLTSTRSCRRQSSTTVATSSRLQTRPSGLCGWQKRSTRVSGVTAASRASSGSSQRPWRSSAGTVTSRRPRPPGASRNGGYTGVIVSTASPGAAKALQARLSPGTTLGSHTSHSGSMRQPYRTSRWAMIACTSDSGTRE